MRKALIIFAVLSRAAGDPCTPCRDPEDSYSFPDKKLYLPGIGLLPCSQVEQMLPSLFQSEDETCQEVQSIGTFCGCMVQENACELCASFDGGAIVSNFIDDHSASCELANSYLQSLQNDDDECQALKDQWSVPCVCREENDKDGSVSNTIPTPQLPPSPPATVPPQNDTKEGFAEIEGACSLCSDGEPPQFGDLDLSAHFMTETAQTYEAIRALGNLTYFSCSMLDNALRYGLAPDMCGSTFGTLAAGVCGCAPIENACTFCQQDEVIPFGDYVDPGYSARTGFTPTCNEIRLGLSQFDKEGYLCWSSETIAFHCGCYGGKAKYYGTTSTRNHVLLAWIPRVTGLFSLLGSLYILRDICRIYRRLKCLSTYHLLLVGMSVFDCFGSLAWIFSSLPLPESNTNGELGIYGARGTPAMCKVQGFFSQMRFIGSTSFNASLTFFYLLVIVYRYSDSKLRPLQKYLVAVPVILAVGLSAAAIPRYGQTFVMCLVPGPFMIEGNVFADGANEANWLYVIIYNILPVGIATLVSVTNMTVICFFVWVTNRKADRWRFDSANHTIVAKTGAKGNRYSSRSFWGLKSNDIASSEEIGPCSSVSHPSEHSTVWPARPPKRKRPVSAVFAQGFWFTVSLLATYLVFLVAQVKPVLDTNDKTLALGFALVTLNPLMGLWNAFVYAKPWTWKFPGKTFTGFLRQIDRNARGPKSEQAAAPHRPADDTLIVGHDQSRPIDLENIPHDSREQFHIDGDDDDGGRQPTEGSGSH